MRRPAIIAQPRTPRAPLPVGVLRFNAPEPRLAVIVKATFVPVPGGGPADPLVLARESTPLTLAAPSPWPGAMPGELGRASDFVPRKPGLDVVLVGCAHADRPAARIDAAFRLGSIHRAFAVLSTIPSERIPLGAAYLRDIDGASAAEAVGPVAHGARPQTHSSGFDYGHYRCAPASQRAAGLPEDAVIELANLAPGGGARSLRLPGLVCRSVLETRADCFDVRMTCDTLEIDTEGPRVTLIFRGDVHDPPGGAVALRRIAVWLEPKDAPRVIAEVRRSLARGTYAFAVEEGDLDGSLPAGEPSLLLMARYDAMAAAPSEPTISLEAYAAISAELTEEREERAKVLARHDLDEERFMLEDRAWGEAMAKEAERGDATLLTQCGELFMDAQERLADPAESAISLDEYVALELAVERAKNPKEVFAERGVRPAAWMRIERRFTRAAAADPALRAELSRKRAALRVEPEIEEDDAEPLPEEGGS